MLEDNAPDIMTLRHSASHVAAQAIRTCCRRRGWESVRLLEDGFYYDFDKPEGFAPEDLEKIEARMKEIVKANLPMIRKECRRRRRRRSSPTSPYKLEADPRAGGPDDQHLPAGRFRGPLPRPARELHRARSRRSSC